MAKPLYTVILRGESALRGLRWQRRVHAHLSWSKVDRAEQDRALANTTCAAGHIDFEELERLGFYQPGETIDVYASDTRRRSSGPLVRAQGRSKLCGGSLLRVRPGIYALSPASLVVDLAQTLPFPMLLSLAEELCGMWSLAERELGPDAFEADLNPTGKPCGYYEGSPVLNVTELRSYHRYATAARGRKAAGIAARYAIGQSRSPMEAIMNGAFSLPCSRGGLNCGPLLPNHRIELPRKARELAGMPYVIADSYLPDYRAVLEYNGSYHDERMIRRRDEARTLGLQSMGIDVYRLNDLQLKNPSDLEAIARMLHKSRGRFFRPRCADYQTRLYQLLDGMRRAVGLRGLT